jgi:hypothetical protein
MREKRRLTAELLNSLLSVNEAAVLLDEGGILTDAGSLTDEISKLIDLLDAKPHPPVIIVTPRMIPFKLRRTANDLSYLSLRALRPEATSRLISRLLKEKSVRIPDHVLSELVKLSDGHPFNIYRMVDEISERGLDAFLASPGDFIDWKHRQSSEYLSKLALSDVETKILAILKMIPELDFASIVSATELEPDAVSDALFALNNNHVLDSRGDHFLVSPALQVAVERDKRIRVSRREEVAAMKKVAGSLSIRLEEGSVLISLVDTAILSALEAGESIGGYAAAFLLPSHYVWMTKRHYDAREWDRSLQLAKEALKGRDRLSLEGAVAACRYLCLSGARIRDVSAFDEGIAALNRLQKNDWVRSNIEFLHGFDARLKGNLPLAEKHFRESYKLSPGNRSTARELAAVCLARGNLDDAEHFAREAHSQAKTNSFLIDILIAVLIRKHGRDARTIAEIDDMFRLLERVGEEGGRSFYTARRAEFEHLWGSNKEALKLIEITIEKTPTIFEPRRIHAEILLKDGNKAKALEAINVMKDMVNSRNAHDVKSNYRSYLETHAKYLTAVGKWADAKRVFDDQMVFTAEERDSAVRDIEIEESYKSMRN